jgi:hypothetical protein
MIRRILDRIGWSAARHDDDEGAGRGLSGAHSGSASAVRHQEHAQEKNDWSISRPSSDRDML